MFQIWNYFADVVLQCYAVFDKWIIFGNVSIIDYLLGVLIFSSFLNFVVKVILGYDFSTLVPLTQLERENEAFLAAYLEQKNAPFVRPVSSTPSTPVKKDMGVSMKELAVISAIRMNTPKNGKHRYTKTSSSDKDELARYMAKQRQGLV